MKKILLVFEDYSELSMTEVYIKKVGFDAKGISNEVLLNDHVMSFNPDVVVGFGKSSRVSSLSIGQKLKENHKFSGKVILVFPKGFKPSAQEMIKLRMDGALEAPVDPIKFIQVLAKLCKLDTLALIEKFRKYSMTDEVLKERIRLTSGDGPSDKVRVTGSVAKLSKYQSFLETNKIDPHQTSFQKNEIKQRQQDLKKDWNFEELEKIDDLKRKFAEALFKKK